MNTRAQPAPNDTDGELSSSSKLRPHIFPILLLPEEMIAEILIQVREEHIRSMLRFHSAYWNHGGWPSYFFICKRIREVALQSPELWSRFALGDSHAKHLQRWIDLHLEKAGHRLCTVYLDLGLGELGAALFSARLDELTRRTRELFIRNDDMPQNLHVHNLIGKAWPVLERMTLVTVEDDIDELLEYNVTDQLPCLGVAMFSGISDSLTSLDLHGSCATMHAFPRLPNLLDLSLSHFTLWFSYGHLRAVLLQASRLVNFRIALLPKVEREQLIETYGPPELSFVLPDLRHVWMSGLSGEVSYLLTTLPRPWGSLSVEIMDDSDDPPPERLALVMQVLDCLDQFSQRSHPVLHTVAIDLRGWDNLPRIRLSPRSSDEAGSGCLFLTLGECHFSTLTLILERVPSAEMRLQQTRFWILTIEAAGECTGPSIEELHIHHWKDKRSTCIAALETYLRRRKEQGHPLKTLIVGNGAPQQSVDQELASLWVAQGWITNIIEKEMKEKRWKIKSH